MTKEIKPVAKVYCQDTIHTWISGCGLNKLPHGADLYGPEAMECIKELEARLEISPEHSYDGIACRDETIRLQDVMIASLEDMVKELEVENAELRKDAERYRWLREWGVPELCVYINGSPSYIWETEPGEGARNLDDAIDNAMQPKSTE